MHDLRHTCASLLIREGAGVMAVSKQLGHSTPTVTLNVYAHLFEDDLDRSMPASIRSTGVRRGPVKFRRGPGEVPGLRMTWGSQGRQPETATDLGDGSVGPARFEPATNRL
jgi:hypothetical protein